MLEEPDLETSRNFYEDYANDIKELVQKTQGQFGM